MSLNEEINCGRGRCRNCYDNPSLSDLGDELSASSSSILSSRAFGIDKSRSALLPFGPQKVHPERRCYQRCLSAPQGHTLVDKELILNPPYSSDDSDISADRLRRVVAISTCNVACSVTATALPDIAFQCYLNTPPHGCHSKC